MRALRQKYNISCQHNYPRIIYYHFPLSTIFPHYHHKYHYPNSAYLLSTQLYQLLLFMSYLVKKNLVYHHSQPYVANETKYIATKRKSQDCTLHICTYHQIIICLIILWKLSGSSTERCLCCI
jgi:hypothetical protein